MRAVSAEFGTRFFPIDEGGFGLRSRVGLLEMVKRCLALLCGVFVLSSLRKGWEEWTGHVEGREWTADSEEAVDQWRTMIVEMHLG